MSKTPKTITTEESIKLLHTLLNTSHEGNVGWYGMRDYIIALLMLDAGMRVGELVQLLVTDLYFGDHPCYNIIIKAKIAKLHKERIVPMSERLKDAVDKYHHLNFMWKDPKPDTFAFQAFGYKGHISIRRVQQIIKGASMRSFGREIHPHVLRHTFATRLMAKTNIRVVQSLLGHSNLSSTQIYTHPNMDDLTTAINNI